MSARERAGADHTGTPPEAAAATATDSTTSLVDGAGKDKKQPPMSVRLIEFADVNFDVFMSDNGRPYGVRFGEPVRALALGKGAAPCR